MDQTEFSGHRVLVLGAKTHNIQILRSVLTIVGVGKIVQVEDGATAAHLLCIEHFNAVFCELGAKPSSPLSGWPAGARACSIP